MLVKTSTTQNGKKNSSSSEAQFNTWLDQQTELNTDLNDNKHILSLVLIAIGHICKTASQVLLRRVIGWEKWHNSTKIKCKIYDNYNKILRLIVLENISGTCPFVDGFSDIRLKKINPLSSQKLVPRIDFLETCIRKTIYERTSARNY